MHFEGDGREENERERQKQRGGAGRPPVERRRNQGVRLEKGIW